LQDNQNDLEAATSTCFQLTTLALTPTDIRHRHRHHGGMSKKIPPPTELQIPATVITLAAGMQIDAIAVNQ